jgi:hypothetical protein
MFYINFTLYIAVLNNPNYYNEKDDQLWQEYKEKHPDDFLELPHQKENDIWKRLDELRKK